MLAKIAARAVGGGREIGLFRAGGGFVVADRRARPTGHGWEWVGRPAVYPDGEAGGKPAARRAARGDYERRVAALVGGAR